MNPGFPKLGEIFEEKYEILELIGSGGIGAVYKARQIDANRLVAIKLLHDSFSREEGVKKRFLREARVLSRLLQANIVTVYHLGESEDGYLYLVMEFIDGVSLRQLLQSQGKLSSARACKIAWQICQALAYMHAAGYIHRDLKPDNIVLVSRPEPDTVKIIDFGLARLAERSLLSKDQKVTETGKIIGSVHYMSPEQYYQSDVDARSDLYALVLCFYEMLSLKRPFEGDSPFVIVSKQAANDFALLGPETVSGFNPLINDVLKKGLDKDPEKRFQSAAELADALSNLQDSLEGISRTLKGRGKSNKLLIPGALLLAALSLTIFFQFFRKAPSSEPLRKSFSTRSEPAGKINSFYKMSSKQLTKLLESEAKNSMRRVDLLLELSDKLSDEKRLETIKEALEICRATERKTHDWTRLLWRSKYEYLEALHRVGRDFDAYRIALEMIEQETKNPRLLDSDLIKRQELMRAKVIAAGYLISAGEKDKAHAYLKQIADFRHGYWRDTISESIRYLIELEDFELARKIIPSLSYAGDSAELAEHCRKKGQSELGYECLAAASREAGARDIKDYIAYLISKKDIKGAFLVQKEHYLYCKYKHQRKKALDCLKDICENPAFGTLRTTGYCSEIREDMDRFLKTAGSGA